VPIYADVDYTIDAGPLTDAAGEPVVGASVAASLLRGSAVVWSGSGTTGEGGSVSIPVADLETVDPDETPGEGQVRIGEILTERVEIESGTLNDVRENRLRVLRRRG